MKGLISVDTDWILKKLCSKSYISWNTKLMRIKGRLLGMRQSLKTESPLTMMKNDFLFHVKSSFCCKGNQTMKFGQLIEFNKRNIFLKISYTKFVRETIPRPFFNQCADHLSLLFIKLCKKYFSHILLTDQISQLDCLYFLKYLVICML